MIKVVIFDLDGTLLNTLQDLTNSTNFALKYFNYPQRTIEEVRNFVGNGVAMLIERAIPNGRKNENFDKCLEIFKQNYSENMNNNTKPYDGILELLKNLREKNYKIAVVSNKFDLAVKDLCKKYFPNLIDIAAGENEQCGIRKKPAPDTVNQVLKDLKLKNTQAIYVGDSEVDIQTAQNSKMKSIIVDWGFRDRKFLYEHGAEVIVSNPSEILDIINK